MANISAIAIFLWWINLLPSPATIVTLPTMIIWAALFTTVSLSIIIARFTIRERGNIGGDIAHSMNIWIELLKRLDE